MLRPVVPVHRGRRAQFAPHRERVAADVEVGVGDVINFDYAPDSGTRITVNGQPRGNAIPGQDFYAAVIRIWIGDKPVDDGLKKGLLGG